jgi:hypothetical protein
MSDAATTQPLNVTAAKDVNERIQTILDFIDNKTKSQVFKTIILIIIFLVICDQILKLTIFITNYSNTFNYGKMMNETCQSNYIEYETERFHISDNIFNLRISNDHYDNQYNLLIIVIALISCLYMTSFLAYIVWTSSVEGVAAAVTGYIFPVFENEYFSKIFDFFSKILRILTVLYIVLIIPIYMVVRQKYGIDISPFNSELLNKIQLVVVMTIIYEIGTKKQISKFTDFMAFAMFYLAFFIIKQLFDIYLKVKSKNGNSAMNSQRYNFNYSQTDPSDENINIFKTFVFEILGWNNTNIKLFSNLDDIDTLDSYKSMIFFIFIVLASLIVIYFVLLIAIGKEQDASSLFAEKDTDLKLLYNFAIVPMLCIFIVLVLITATKEYNTYVNKNILYEPVKLYKTFISEISKIFNKIIVNDGANVSNRSVCKNMVNALHLTIYQNIFNGYKNEIFTPELLYVPLCDKDAFVDYNSIRQYNIDYYLKDDTNIFYKDNKCTSINDDIIISVMKNFRSSQDFAETTSNFKNAVINIFSEKTYDGKRHLVMTNDFRNNNTILRDSSVILLNKNASEDLLRANDLKIIEYVTQEYINYTTSMYDYSKRIVQALCKCNKIDDFTKDEANWQKKLEETVPELNGAYSLSIKKNFITKFKVVTTAFLQTINESFTYQVRFSEMNYKLSKHVIKNYNIYQQESFRKYRKDTLDEPDQKRKTFPDKHEDMNEINMLIDKINNIIIKMTSTITDEDIYNLESDTNKLINEKKKYNDVYDLKKTYEFSSYFAILHDYKNEYIANVIKLCSKLHNILKNPQNEKPAIDTFIKGLEEYKQEYDRKYTALYNLSTDKYKDQLYLRINAKSSQDRERLSRNKLANADNTSVNIYTLIVIYMTLILLANFIE